MLVLKFEFLTGVLRKIQFFIDGALCLCARGSWPFEELQLDLDG